MSDSNFVTLSVEGMSCASCVGRVDRALAAVSGVQDVSVNLAAETATFAPRAEPGPTIAEVAETLTALGYPARTATATLTVASMSCGSCVGRVDRALASVPGVQSVAVNLAAETATVVYLQGAVTPSDLVAASTAAGYVARLAGSGESESHAVRKAAEASALARRALVAGLLTLPVFLMEMGGHLIPAVHAAIASTIGMQGSWLLQFVLVTLVLFGPGFGFFANGLPALARGAPDMNSLVALGAGAAWVYSTLATFLPGLLPEGVRAVYFEAAAVIVVLILLGRWLESRARGRTGAAIQALLGLQARTAQVLRDGTETEVEIDALQVGDSIVLRPGARIPVDGIVTEGSSRIDESMITGEPVPVSKAAGAAVTGGTVNGAGSLVYRATRVGSDTTLAQIIRMVEQAQGAKLPIQDLVDWVTMRFVPAVLVVALVTIAVWLAVGPGLTFALVAGVSVLIIACPCAMGLATPTSIMVGTGRAAEMGVLFRKGDALQALGEVRVVAFDKTGTVTLGKPALTDLEVAGGFDGAEVLRLVASVQHLSEHPIARAILGGASARGVTLAPVTEFASITGYGVSGAVEGHSVLVGGHRLMQRDRLVPDAALAASERALAEQGRTVVYAAVDGQIAALIAVADPVKPGSASAIAALQARGYRTALITGDRQATAEAIARETGIDRVIADVLPDGKVAALEALRAQGDKVAFVGDGINDAPALAHADIGIAIGTGTDVAIESADVVLMSGDLRGVVNAIAVSRATLRNIRQNLLWAFGYNAALIPVAAGVLYPAFGLLLSPMFAAGAMALSSVSVLTNALRLRRLSPVLTEPGSGGDYSAATVRAPAVARASSTAVRESSSDRAIPSGAPGP